MDFGIKPLKISPIKINPLGGSPTRKRSIGQGDKVQVYERAKGKCEACGKKISYGEMQVGHARAYAKGGATHLGNSIALCYACNRMMRTKNYYKFMKEMGYKLPSRLKQIQEVKEKAKAEKPIRKRRRSQSLFNFNFRGI